MLLYYTKKDYDDYDYKAVTIQSQLLSVSIMNGYIIKYFVGISQIDIIHFSFYI